MDFIRGAAIGDDGLGKPIIALPSISKRGQSKIVPFITEVCCSFRIDIQYGASRRKNSFFQGSGIVTSRAHVHYVVTEYGIAQLWGKNMRQRAYELIKIAHPTQRELLEKAAFKRLKVSSNNRPLDYLYLRGPGSSSRLFNYTDRSVENLLRSWLLGTSSAFSLFSISCSFRRASRAAVS